ncbi:MAG: DNA-3-methyladenine glycosylase I [Alphaproteobacteria bacterium]|nr:DNA-3-methyladenine glycosylase I [Alphaproteobacteria bacterium]
MKRCSWVDLSEPEYIQYHDCEWGVPVYDDGKLFEMLLLESFQAGLSWLTILKRRREFAKAFDNFDVKKVSKYDENKINELMKNDKIIRHRLKIQAAVSNAKVFLQIQKEWGSFSNYLWHWMDNQIIQGNGTLVRSELSDRVSADLRKKGMKFVGSVIIYSFLQAVGIINDHQQGCFKKE